MARRVRTAASMFFVMLAISFAALWVRSCWRSDSIHIIFQKHRFEAWSAAGEISWGEDHPVYNADRNDIVVRSTRLSPQHDKFMWFGWDGDSVFPTFGFATTLGHHGPLYTLPHWFAVLIFAAFASSLVWRAPVAAHFSLRTMLIATTLIAFALGLVVIVSR